MNIKRLEKLNIGDVIYECEYGMTIAAELTTKPKICIAEDGKLYLDNGMLEGQEIHIR